MDPKADTKYLGRSILKYTYKDHYKNAIAAQIYLLFTNSNIFVVCKWKAVGKDRFKFDTNKPRYPNPFPNDKF